MGDIYKRASRVLAWLGEADEDSDLAFDILNQSYRSSEIGEADSPESTEFRSVKSDMDYEKAVVQSHEPASSADGTEDLLPLTANMNNEEVLHQRMELPRWLTGGSAHRIKAQQIFVDPDTIQLPPGGGCRQCERRSTICWWDGQGQCVRCLMGGGKAAGYCSLFESEASSDRSPKEGRDEESIKVAWDPATKHPFNIDSKKLGRLESPEEIEKGWHALTKLVERPWWRRVWILQEIVVNKIEPIIMCGCKQTPWSTIVNFCNVPSNPVATVRGNGYLNRYLHFSICTGTYRDTREIFRKYSSVNLQHLLHETLALESSDARDKVFSLFSLTHPIERLNLEPDYSLSMVTVYTRTALYIISQPRI